MTKKSKILYDATTALIYPAVLGSIIYSFLDNLTQFISNSEKVNYLVRFAFFIIFSLVLVIHFCVDYLYSKYSESEYSIFHFFSDTLIAGILGFSYIKLSNSVAEDIHSVRNALGWFWVFLFVIYAIFCFWDKKTSLNEEKKGNEEYVNFYNKMVMPFEMVAMIIYVFLCFCSFKLIKHEDAIAVIVVIIGILSYSLITFWFAKKTSKLVAMSKKK